MRTDRLRIYTQCVAETKRQRNIRIEDSIWEPAQEAAEKNDETVSDVVRRGLVQYVEQTKEQER